MLHPFVVFYCCALAAAPVEQAVDLVEFAVDRRHLLGERNSNDLVRLRIDVHLDWLAVKVAGLGLPVLALALVGRQFDGVPVAQMKGLVNIEHALDVILAGGKIGQASCGIAKGRSVDDHWGTGGKGIDVGAERLLRLRQFLFDLEARLVAVVGRDQQQYVAIDRRAARFFGKRNLEAQARRLGREICGEQRKNGKPQKNVRTERQSCGQGALPREAMLISASTNRGQA